MVRSSIFYELPPKLHICISFTSSAFHISLTLIIHTYSPIVKVSTFKKLCFPCVFHFLCMKILVVDLFAPLHLNSTEKYIDSVFKIFYLCSDKSPKLHIFVTLHLSPLHLSKFRILDLLKYWLSGPKSYVFLWFEAWQFWVHFLYFLDFRPST